MRHQIYPINLQRSLNIRMKFYLLLNEGEINEAQKNELVIYGLRRYAEATGKAMPNEIVIKKTEKGKPYLEDSDIHFSISHSGLLWVMLVGEGECGIDIQVMNAAAWKNISKRYFSLNEQNYTEKYGIEGFFRVWVHRESYGKLTGEGFFGKMPDFIDDEGYPKIEVDVKENISQGTEALEEFKQIAEANEHLNVKSSNETNKATKAYIKDVPVDDNIFLAFATYGEDDELDFLT